MGWQKGRPNYAKRVPVEERFESKLFRTEGHWLWVGAHKPTGYGMFYFNGDKNFIAHRASYIMHKGEIPDDLVVDHACKVKSCVNPDHLRLVKQSDNCTIYARPTPFMANKAKTVCLRGHPFDTTTLRRGKPHRNCSICIQIRKVRAEQRRLAKQAVLR